MVLVSLCRNLRHLLVRQLKLGQSLEISSQPRLLGAGCERDNSLIENPSEADVRVSNAVLLRQLVVDGDHWAALDGGDWYQGAVGSNCNVVLLVERNEIAVLEVGVVLDLVDCGHHLGCLEDSF